MQKPKVLLKVLPRNVPYQTIHDYQMHLVSQRICGNSTDNYLLAVEHPPTFTAGRRIKQFEDAERLSRLNADFVFTQRGGQVTFHGPGQLVMYPIINLKEFNVRFTHFRLVRAAL
jgi:lipoyl(octanoyl) transferase